MSIVTLFVTGSNVSCSERRFNRDITIQRLKERLEPITGASSNYMKLKLYDNNEGFVCELDDEARMLGFYSPNDFYRIDVIDVNPYAVKGGFTDTTLVDKFEMDESEYDKRTDSVRDFKRRHKIGRFADSKMEVTGTDVTEEEKVDPAIVSGVRCEVSADGFQRRGTVRFVGPIEELKAGVWAGVEYDEPLGKNDGKIQGRVIFDCKSKHGAFVRPSKITVGDFPEEDLFGDDLDLEEM